MLIIPEEKTKSNGRFYFSKTHGTLQLEVGKVVGRESRASVDLLARGGPEVLWDQSCERHLFYDSVSTPAPQPWALGSPWILTEHWAMTRAVFQEVWLCGCGWPLECQKTRWTLYSMSITKHQLWWATAWHPQHVHISKNNKQYLCVYWWEGIMYDKPPAQ